MQKELTILPGGVVDEWDVCAVTTLSKKTLWNYRRKGKLNYSKVGRRIYYRLEDIEKLMNGTL